MNISAFLANKCFEFLLDAPSRNITSSPPKINCLPPWSLELVAFKQACNGCGCCVDSCENDILILDGDGYPRVDFTRGYCSFCGACAKSCSEGAISQSLGGTPWNLRAQITSKCLSGQNIMCRTCIEHCREGAIVTKTGNLFGLPVVQKMKCTGCGACVHPCPVAAIKI